MSKIDAEDPREVPIHIDTNDRLGESVIVFIILFLLSNVIRVVFGLMENAVLVCFGAGITAAICYYRISRGKPDGFLLHFMSRLGSIPVTGLIAMSVKKIRR